jgi:hypothetical protein
MRSQLLFSARFSRRSRIRAGRKRSAQAGALKRRNYWTRLPAAALCAAALLSPSVSRAGAGGPSTDGVSLPAEGAAPDLSASLSLSRYDARNMTQSDVLFGRNSPGPYSLSWKNVRAFSETVVCDGKTLRRDVDYDFDPDAGTVQFHAPLTTGQMASVTYLCDTPDATPNPGKLAIPFQWGLWQRGTNSVALRAVYNGEDTANPNATNPSMLTSLVYQGGVRLSSTSDIAAKLFYDLRGGGLWDRNGLQLSENSHWKTGAFGVTYSQAGAEFIQDAAGVTPGKAILASTASVNARPNLTFAANATQTQTPADKTGATAASTETALGGSVTLTLPKSAGKLEADRSQTVTDSTTKTTTDTTAVHLDSTPLARWKQWKQLNVKVNLEDDQTQSDLQRKREFLVNLPPLPLGHTELSGGVRLTSDPTHAQTVGVIDAITHPFRYVQVSGGTRLRDGNLTDGSLDPNAVDSYTAKVAFTPTKRLTLTGDYAYNPEAADGTAQRLKSHGFGLETDLGFVHIKGSYSLENQYLANQLSWTRGLGLDFRLTHWDTLTTGYQNSGIFAGSLTGTTTYQLGFTHKIGAAFDLSLNGSLVLPSAQNATNLDGPELKGEAKIGLRF